MVMKRNIPTLFDDGKCCGIGNVARRWRTSDGDVGAKFSECYALKTSGLEGDRRAGDGDAITADEVGDSLETSVLI